MADNGDGIGTGFDSGKIKINFAKAAVTVKRMMEFHKSIEPDVEVQGVEKVEMHAKTEAVADLGADIQMSNEETGDRKGKSKEDNVGDDNVKVGISNGGLDSNSLSPNISVSSSSRKRFNPLNPGQSPNSILSGIDRNVSPVSRDSSKKLPSFV